MTRKRFVALAAATIVGAAMAACSASTTGPASTSATRPSTTTAGGSATQIRNEVAVNASGQPVNGYHENTGDQTVPDQADCTEPSPAAVSKDIYRCYPTAYGADVCWPASDLDLLCMNDPWAKELHRIRARAALPQVSPPNSADPVGLLLDDGTHCRLRNGGAWGYRYDNLYAFYGCADRPGLDVLASQNTDPIDRSSPVWTVKVGTDEARDSSSPPPVTHRIQTAWFAGS